MATSPCPQILYARVKSCVNLAAAKTAYRDISLS